MTQEGGHPSPDETTNPITPPASTRWSEDPVDDAGGLAPPYVPGRPDRVEGPAVESLSAETAESVEGDAEADAFPFEQPAVEETDAQVLSDEAPPLQPEETAPVEDTEAWSSEEFQVDEPTGAGATGPATGAGETGLEEGWREPEDEAPWGPPLDEAPAEPVATPTRGEEPREEIAALLERLAAAIRAGGAEGIRDEIDSPDRLTSLLAGLLSGHLSARS